jgi:hypothetical protein
MQGPPELDLFCLSTCESTKLALNQQESAMRQAAGHAVAPRGEITASHGRATANLLQRGDFSGADVLLPAFDVTD